MKKSVLLGIIIGLCCFFLPAPETNAFEPVTIALLAPVALKAAKEASPYIIRGLANGGKGMMLIGKDMIDILRLPWGAVQSTAGMPFGGLGPGLKNMFVGGAAPFMMTFHTLMLPLYCCGVGI